MECSAAIDYLVYSVIDKMKRDKTSQSKGGSADSPERGGTQVKRRRLADTPLNERPPCRFYLEGKCGKVTKAVCL